MTLPLDELLDRLCDGDAAAAERVFVEFEPYLRKAIRRQLRGRLRHKFDSADILQSVWVDLLRGFRERGWRFADADQLRGFLFVATRNRLIDRSRKYQNASREESLGEDERPGQAGLVAAAPERDGSGRRSVDSVAGELPSRAPPDALPAPRGPFSRRDCRAHRPAS